MSREYDFSGRMADAKRNAMRHRAFQRYPETSRSGGFAMRTCETTNGKLDEVKAAVQTLIEWADADAQHAAESDAPDTAKDDVCRARVLRKAYELLASCTR